MNKVKGTLIGGLLGLMFIGIVSLVFWPSESRALSDPLTRFTSYEISCTTTAKTFRNIGGFTPTKAVQYTNGATQIFIGGSNVNATTLGTPLAVSGVLSIDGSAAALYCITASGTSTVDVFGAD